MKSTRRTTTTSGPPVAEKVLTSWIVQNLSDDYLGDKATGIYAFRTERDAKAAAATAGPNFTAKRVRLNSGDVKR